MNQQRIQAWLLLFIIFGSLLTFAYLPYTPERSIYNEDWNGASKFREDLEKKYNYTTSRILVSPIILDAPHNISIMVIIGSDRKYSDGEMQSYVKFVERGGSLVLFEDSGPGKSIAGKFGIQFWPGIIKETDKYGTTWVNRPSQIMILDILTETFIPGANLSPLLASNVKAVTDITGFIIGTTWPILFTYPSAFIDSNDNDILDKDDWAFPDGIPVAVFKPIGNGTVAVIGSSSIPLNQYWNKQITIVDQETFTQQVFTLSNAAWSLFLIRYLVGIHNNTHIVFDESHQAISITSASGLLNLIAGTWIGLINTSIISLGILAIAMMFTGINSRSRIKSRFFRRNRSPQNISEENDVLISHPSLAERLISEQYILHQVMGENYIHVANSNLIKRLQETGKAEEFLKEIREEYGQDLKSPNTFQQLLDLHLKLQKFVEENKNRLL
ncbi:MAG: DUF4350 domain-containing protein [Candidatus Kariarchaeaceae archaeon]